MFDQNGIYLNRIEAKRDQGYFSDIVWTPDGHAIILENLQSTEQSTGPLRLISWDTKSVTKTLEFGNNTTYNYGSLLLSNDGRYLALDYSKHEINSEVTTQSIYLLSTDTFDRLLVIPANGNINMQFSPNSQYLEVDQPSDSYTLNTSFYSLSTYNLSYTTEGNNLSNNFDWTWSNNGFLMASYNVPDHTIEIYSVNYTPFNLTKFKVINQTLSEVIDRNKEPWISGIVFSPDDRFLTVSGIVSITEKCFACDQCLCDNAYIIVIDVESGGTEWVDSKDVPRYGIDTSIQYSEDGKRLVYRFPGDNSTRGFSLPGNE